MVSHSPFIPGYQSCEEFLCGDSLHSHEKLNTPVVRLDAPLRSGGGWWQRFGVFGAFIADVFEVGQTEESKVGISIRFLIIVQLIPFISLHFHSFFEFLKKIISPALHLLSSPPHINLANRSISPPNIVF